MKTLVQTFCVILAVQGAAIHAADRPNVLWFVIDDMSANFLKQLRDRLEKGIKETGDPGPETPAVYVLETEDQMKSTRNPASRANYRKNSELYKCWASEGK